MKLRITLFTLVSIILTVSCQNSNKKTTENNLYDYAHKVVVSEVIQATAYTYLNVEENGESFWIAITKKPIEEGATLYYDGGLEMTNFKSKDLNRTFESIFFVQGISDQPLKPGKKNAALSNQPQKPQLSKMNISVEAEQGTVRIAALYANRETYKDKVIKIRGQVTKINKSIMGKNWIHIQDGTESEGNFDLTITTNAEAEVGDVVTFEGKISLNRDFGSGYSYELIMEEAQKVESN